jgi:hypothetical protein
MSLHVIEELGPVAFFNPTPEFVDWLITYANGRRIVDCGAGIGLLEHELRAHGYTNVESIDANQRYGTLARVSIWDATQFPFTPDDLAMICRPCHDTWIEWTIGKATGNGAECLYVGLERNIGGDLPLEFVGEGVRHDIVAGEDDEIVVGFAAMTPAPVPG